MPRPTLVPSDRSFGVTFVAVFALLAIWLWVTGRSGAWAVVGLSGATLLISLARPSVLSPLNKAWMRLAELLHRVISPIVLGLVYFAVITPYAWTMRRFGRDALRCHLDPAARSYWIERKPAGPAPDSFTRQF
jgi:hypothetical protein